MLLFFIVVCFTLPRTAIAPARPSGCEFKDDVYTCNYRIITPPLEKSGFDPQPQRLVLNEVEGALTSSTFKDFSEVNETAFDLNYIPSLTIVCKSGSILALDNTSFDGLSFFLDVKMVNCQFNSIPGGSFSNLGTLNSLSFEGGTIDNLHAEAFSGVRIIKTTTYSNPKGEFSLANTKLLQGGLGSGVLDTFRDASSITLTNCKIQVMGTDLFKELKYLTRVTLDNNPLTYIPNNVFDGLESLQYVSVDNIPWTCDCDALWFLNYARDNGIDLKGDMLCALPTKYTRKKISSYQKNECGSLVSCPQGTYPLSGVCVTWLHIFSFVISFVSAVVLIVCLAFIIRNRRDICKTMPKKPVVKSVAGHRAAPKKVAPFV